MAHPPKTGEQASAASGSEPSTPSADQADSPSPVVTDPPPLAADGNESPAPQASAPPLGDDPTSAPVEPPVVASTDDAAVQASEPPDEAALATPADDAAVPSDAGDPPTAPTAEASAPSEAADQATDPSPAKAAADDGAGDDGAGDEPEAAPAPTTFDDLDLADPIRRAVQEMGWEAPTGVQVLTFAPMADGRDILVQSQTGSGKTGAFCLPWLAKRFEDTDPAQTGVQMLVLTPTRELAKQVCGQLEELGRHTNLRTLPVYGGTAMQPQLQALREGVHAVVGTPGRILDHIRRRSLKLGQVRMAVLDEADEMLSMGFLEDIHAILDACATERQTCLFSATVPPDIERIARRYMRNPESVLLSGDQVAAAEIKHIYYQVAGALKVRDLLDMVNVEEPANGLVFCNTREETYVVASALRRDGYEAEPLSSDLTQAARERVMGRMRDGQLRFLVATDVASRGIDISHIGHVINYSFPENAESYVHRTGRTGRAGRPGIAISLISPQELGNHYYLKLQYPSIEFEERDLPPAAELTRQRLETKLDRISRLFPELVAPEWTLLTRHLVSDPRGEQVLAFLLKEAMTIVNRKRDEGREEVERRPTRSGDRRGRGGDREERGDWGRGRGRRDESSGDGGRYGRGRRDESSSDGDGGYRGRRDESSGDGEGRRSRGRRDESSGDGEGRRSRGPRDESSGDGEGRRSRGRHDESSGDGEGRRSRGRRDESSGDGEGRRSRGRRDESSGDGEGRSRQASSDGEAARGRGPRDEAQSDGRDGRRRRRRDGGPSEEGDARRSRSRSRSRSDAGGDESNDTERRRRSATDESAEPSGEPPSGEKTSEEQTQASAPVTPPTLDAATDAVDTAEAAEATAAAAEDPTTETASTAAPESSAAEAAGDQDGAPRRSRRRSRRGRGERSSNRDDAAASEDAASDTTTTAAPDGGSAPAEASPDGEPSANDGPDAAPSAQGELEAGQGATDGEPSEDGEAGPRGRRRRRRRGRRRPGDDAPRSGADDLEATADAPKGGETVAPTPTADIHGEDHGSAIEADASPAEDQETIEAGPGAETVTDPGTITGVTARRRRRRRRRRGRGPGAEGEDGAERDADAADQGAKTEAAPARSDDSDGDDKSGDDGRRRRRRRGGRRRTRGGDSSASASPAAAPKSTHVSQDKIVIDIDETELDVVRDEFGEIDELDDLTLKGRRRGVMDALQDEVELEDLSQADREAEDADGEDDDSDAGDSLTAGEIVTEEGDDDGNGDPEPVAAQAEGEDPRETKKRKRRRRRRRKKAAPAAPPELTAPPHKDFWEVWAAKYTYEEFEDAVYLGGTAAVVEEPDPPPPPPRPSMPAVDDEDTFVRVRLNVGRKHGKKAAHIRELLAESFGLARKAVRDLTVGEASSRFRLGEKALAKLEEVIVGFDFDGVALTVTRVDPKPPADPPPEPEGSTVQADAASEPGPAVAEPPPAAAVAPEQAPVPATPDEQTEAAPSAPAERATAAASDDDAPGQAAADSTQAVADDAPEPPSIDAPVVDDAPEAVETPAEEAAASPEHNAPT